MRIVSKLFNLIAVVVILALILLLFIMGKRSDIDPMSASVSVQLNQTGSSDSLAALENAFGCSLPYTSLSGTGSVRSVRSGSITAALAEWHNSDGLVIRAVRPVFCADLLLEDGMNIQSSWTMGPYSGILSRNDQRCTAFLSTDDAVYSFTLNAADSDALFSLLSTLHFSD